MSRERIMLTQAIPAVQQLRRVQGFDPLRFLKRNANGGIELEPRYQRLWFRLACPDGKMLLNRLRITDQIAVYEAQVFLSREDNQPIANFTAAVEKAQAPAGRYVQAAQDAALKTALDNAGFGIQLCEINPASPETPEIVYAGKIFRLNDRVMQMRNNYDIKLYDRSGKQVGEGVFNGDIGTIRKISGTNVVIEFDGRYMDCPQVLLDDLELSYAITIHKSMGSEYDTVIIPLLAAHNVLLTRNLLYTAITRAKRRVLLVGEKRALYMAIHRSRKGKRNTMLGERIALYYKAVTRKALRSEEGEEWQRAS